MLQLAIIDDDSNMRKRICDLITDTYSNISIQEFESAEQILTKFEDMPFDIILSDIEMGNMKGTELGKVVRERYPDIVFIFLTSYPEYAAESYVINVYQYVLKNEMEQRLPEILKSLIYKLENSDERYRIIKTRFEAHKVFLKDIIYIKKIKGDKYAQFHTSKGIFSERISLEQILKELSDEFIMVERGYIVNYNHIISLKGNTLYLTDGETVVISRARASAVKEQIFMCWEKMQ